MSSQLAFRVRLVVACALGVALLCCPGAAFAGANTWTTTGPSNGTFCTVVASPNYAADHTLFAGGTFFGAAGIFKSTVAGEPSWTPINTGLPADAHVNALAVSPAYASDHTVLAATEWGVYKTTNGGTSWSEADTGLPGYPAVEGLAPFNMKTVAFSPDYATDHTVFLGGTTWGAAGILKSTSVDTSWTAVVTGLPPEAHPNCIAVSPAYASDHTVLAATEWGVYKSTNGGTSWSEADTGLPGYPAVEGLAPFNMKTVAFSPDYATDHTVFLGGTTWGAAGILKSTDSGASWVQVVKGIAPEARPHMISISPDYATDHTVFAATDTGIFMSMDGAATWSAFNAGIAYPAYSIFASPDYTTDKTLFAGSNAAYSYTLSDLVVTPIEGTDRIATAISASQEAFANGSSQYAVITTAYNWPDALGGSALAGALECPILLTPPDALPDEVAAEIDRLGATNVIVLGGTSAITEETYAAIDALAGVSVERISGADRYETAGKIAARTITELGVDYGGSAFVATGRNFPDALGASPLAAAKGWPIYLADPADGDNADLAATMKAVGVTNALILGGTTAVSSAVETAMSDAVGSAERLDGDDRYATAIEVATYGVSNAGLHWDELALATGTNFPDALSGGVLQGKAGSVMLLTPSTELNDDVGATLTANKDAIRIVRFLGGTSAISDTVRGEVAAILQ